MLPTILTTLITRSTSPTGLIITTIEYLQKKKKLPQLPQSEKNHPLIQLISLHHLIADKKRIFLLNQIYSLHALTDYVLHSRIQSYRNLIVLPQLRYVSRSRPIKNMLINDSNVNMVSNIKLVLQSQPLIEYLSIINASLRG